MASENTGTQESNGQTAQDTEAQAQDGQGSDNRTAVQKDEQYRFANNVPDNKTIAEREYEDYVLEYDEDDASLNGKQRFLCKDCGRNSREDPQPNGYTKEKREQILRAYQERSSLRGLSRTFG